MKEFIEYKEFKNLLFDLKGEFVRITNIFYPNTYKEKIMNDRMSNCCKARVKPDSDICLDCGEHCMLVCPDCYGRGKIEVLAGYQGDLITPRTRLVTCETCEGYGEVEAL